jgi:hypothetical protein
MQQQGTGSPLMLRQELGERMKEVANLRSELERVRKDKGITSGLVTQMQRDMSNKVRPPTSNMIFYFFIFKEIVFAILFFRIEF